MKSAWLILPFLLGVAHGEPLKVAKARAKALQASPPEESAWTHTRERKYPDSTSGKIELAAPGLTNTVITTGFTGHGTPGTERSFVERGNGVEHYSTSVTHKNGATAFLSREDRTLKRWSAPPKAPGGGWKQTITTQTRDAKGRFEKATRTTREAHALGW